jgi:hypothetical protein
VDGTFKSELWDRYVLQLSLTEPCLHHAKLALGAVHHSLTTNESVKEYELFAIQQYNKAISYVIRPSKPLPLIVVLVACWMFSCFEVMRGEHNVFGQHLTNGLWPIKDEQGVRFASPVHENSMISLVPIVMYGIRFRWIVKNPQKSVIKRLSAAPFHVTFREVASAYSKVNKSRARFEPKAIDGWMAAASASIPVDNTLPRGSTKDDPTFGFGKSFTVWWNLWRDSAENMQEAADLASWADEYYPERSKTIEEWMNSSRYTFSSQDKPMSFQNHVINFVVKPTFVTDLHQLQFLRPLLTRCTLYSDETLSPTTSFPSVNHKSDISESIVSNTTQRCK